MVNKLLELLNPYRWLAALIVVAVIVGGFLWYRSSLIAEGERRANEAAATARAEAQALADAQARNMQEIVDEAQAKYVKEVADARAAADRANAQLARLRNQAASATQLANASQQAVSDYAASAERDLDWCAERLVGVGETAAGASAAAHALYDAWPEYREFQDRLTTFTQTLKGN